MQNLQQIFKLHSEYKPTGDQPQAIEKLVKGFKEGNQFETLLGVTGSGKTFTMANVIAKLNKPTLVLAHNKTLAAQLYGEFKEFFPENAVEYFVSYYDYYQPEAYVPSTDTIIGYQSSLLAAISIKSRTGIDFNKFSFGIPAQKLKSPFITMADSGVISSSVISVPIYPCRQDQINASSQFWNSAIAFSLYINSPYPPSH